MRVVYGIGGAVPSHERSLACRYRDRVVAEVARERGVPLVEWSTAPDNRTAQYLYDSTGAERSEWFTYELRV